MLVKVIIGILIIILLLLLLRAGELFTQLNRYKTYWNKQNQQVLATSSGQNIRYYALGDSAAQGVGATSPEKSYPNLIAQHLNQANGKSVELINLSKSGAKIGDVLREQLPIMQSLGVKDNTVATIEIGANDITTFEAEKFEREMDELMQKLPAQTVISDLPSFEGSRLSKYESSVLEANEIIVRLSDKYNLKRAALYDKVAANHGISTFAADLFHPSNRGYKTNWAPAFIEQLQQSQ